MAYVYILQSKQDASYYIGQTENIADRLHKHNTAQSVSTKAKIPWDLVYAEEFDTRSSAAKRESQIKNQ